MDTRRAVGWALATMAVVAVGILVVQTAVVGLPSLPAVVLAALLVGTAAAWPVASRPQAVHGPVCGDCGYPSWASIELHFCIRCGSKRIWHVDAY